MWHEKTCEFFFQDLQIISYEVETKCDTLHNITVIAVVFNLSKTKILTGMPINTTHQIVHGLLNRWTYR